MLSVSEKDRIRAISDVIEKRIQEKHIGCFTDSDIPLFFISTEYPGIWLEHVYDSVVYAQLYPSALSIQVARNTIRFFIDHQTEEGKYPCYCRDYKKAGCSPKEALGYSHIQECVSFARLGLEVCEMTGDRILAEELYESAQRWDSWLRKYRMTRGTGLIEMFVGYDTGHDWSGRLQGLSCPDRYEIEGHWMNAKILPPDEQVAPIIAVDMNATFFGTQKALAELARICGRPKEAKAWEKKAAEVKRKLFEFCYDAADAFFYDVDKYGKKRKYLSSTIFHLFMEGVLDKEADKELIQEIYHRHIKNPKEFWTEYPFPSMAACDPSCRDHKTGNCWGYYSEGLIALRCIRWMDAYGFSKDFDHICMKWLRAWTACFNKIKLGQELDPHTGEPTAVSEWYSSCMLFYLYAARRLECHMEK